MNVTRSHFVVTPGIEKYTHYPVILNLLSDRVRAVLMGETHDFKTLAEQYVQKFLTPPEFQNDESSVKRMKFYHDEAKVVFKNFEDFEKNQAYQDSIRILREFEGKNFSISSVTTNGLMVLIYDVEDKLNGY